MKIPLRIHGEKQTQQFINGIKTTAYTKRQKLNEFEKGSS